MNNKNFYFLLKFKKVCLTLTTILLALPILSAQNSVTCGNRALVEARKAYDIGKFEEVIGHIEQCNKFVDDPQSNLLEEAYVILASTYVAMDELGLAQDYVIKLINLNPGFQYRNEDPIIFKQLVDDARGGNFETQISSVSKVSENIYEAPATVLLITEEQIKQRGYQDLEAVLHDLPGFDISRTNGILYSNIYQRGYRSDNTNRTLFLIDGVEDNDLWGNAVFFSRQYAMSNIKSVEVMYGPASTIYGANAFLGVVSVNTKSPSDFIKDGQRFGVQAEAGYGAWNTRYGDVTFAAKLNNQVEVSLTGRVFQSNEADWGHLEDFDYEQEPFDEVKENYINKLSIDSSNQSALDAFLAGAENKNPSYYTHTLGAAGDTIGVVLTEEGAFKAWDLDKKVLDQTEYADHTNAHSISARIKIAELLIGWNLWWKDEGFGTWFNDYKRGTSGRVDAQGDRQAWRPNSNSFFLKYDKNISKKISITSFTRYKVHGLHPNNKISNRNAYENGRRTLSQLLDDTESSWTDLYLTVRSNQVRNETRLNYRLSSQFNIVSGFEARFSATQANYAQSLFPNPEEEADLSDGLNNLPRGGNHFFTRDLGFFAQANIEVIKDLKLTLGGRLDHNRIRNEKGYGEEFNPRIAVVYSPNDFVFKAIYARAFKDATFFDRFSTVAGLREVPADGPPGSERSLTPERVRNFEFSARRIFKEKLNIEIGGYRASYGNAIETESYTGVYNGVDYSSNPTSIFASTGKREISGLFANIDYKFRNFGIYGNYTYTLPWNVTKGLTNAAGDPVERLRIADMASHQINAVVNYRIKDFNINLRANWVGAKDVGDGTTVAENTWSFPAYIVFNGALSYDLGETGLSFQAVLNNLLNTMYYSPGIRTANGIDYAMALPQNPMNLHFKVRYSF